MAVTRLNCPECDAVLRLTGEVTAGEPIDCPKCGKSFRPTAKQLSGGAVVARRAPARDDEDDDYDDQPRKRRKAPAKKTNPVIFLVPIIAVGVLVAGGLVIWSLTKSSDKAEPVAAAPPPGPGALRPADGAPTNPPLPNVPRERPKANPPLGGLPKAATPAGGNVVGLEVGNIAMEIDAEDVHGKKFKLSDYRGKVVVLDFWGHW